MFAAVYIKDCGQTGGTRNRMFKGFPIVHFFFHISRELLQCSEKETYVNHTYTSGWERHVWPPITSWRTLPAYRLQNRKSINRRKHGWIINIKHGKNRLLTFSLGCSASFCETTTHWPRLNNNNAQPGSTGVYKELLAACMNHPKMPLLTLLLNGRKGQ